MLKVKHLTPLKPKKWKKGGNFDQGWPSYGHFLPTTFEKWILLYFFRQSDPPPPYTHTDRKSQNVKMRNFCNKF